MIAELKRTIAVVLVLILCARLLRGKTYEKQALRIILMLYGTGVLYFTMFRGSRANVGGVNFRMPLPFSKAIQTRHYGVTTNRSVLNVLLFTPFGYLLPPCVSLSGPTAKIKGWQVVGAGFALSFLIEICQLLFHRGVLELDDLVKNTLGASLGWLIWSALDRITLHKDSNTC